MLKQAQHQNLIGSMQGFAIRQISAREGLTIGANHSIKSENQSNIRPTQLWQGDVILCRSAAIALTASGIAWHVSNISNCIFSFQLLSA
jgi:hypothetical protein